MSPNRPKTREEKLKWLAEQIGSREARLSDVKDYIEDARRAQDEDEQDRWTRISKIVAREVEEWKKAKANI